MKAIVQDRYGSADVLKLEDIDKPTVGGGNVLLRVQAASVFIGDWLIMEGLPYAIRPRFGLRAPKTRIRGQDVAGRVEAVGNHVTRIRPGDEVFGVCEGSLAEYATTQAGMVAPKPTNLTFEQAATVPIAGTSALQALRDKGGVQAGQKVLIIGAAGGLGSFAVQIAKAFGAHVTGVCSSAQVDLIRSLGADVVVDYTREDFAEAGRRYDLIFDTAGVHPISHFRRALAPRGTLVIVGGKGGGGRWFGIAGRMLWAPLLSRFVSQKLVTLIATHETKDLIVLKELIEAGKVTPLTGQTYPLSEVPRAFRALEEGHAQGKIIIAVEGPAEAGRP